MLLKALIDGLNEVSCYRVRVTEATAAFSHGDGEPGSALSQCVGLFLCTCPGPAGGVRTEHRAGLLWCVATLPDQYGTPQLPVPAAALKEASEWF